MKRGLKVLGASGRTMVGYGTRGYIPCPDEKGTESIIILMIGSYLPLLSYIPCPDEKGTERRQIQWAGGR